jgi:hypothetical protein
LAPIRVACSSPSSSGIIYSDMNTVKPSLAGVSHDHNLFGVEVIAWMVGEHGDDDGSRPLTSAPRSRSHSLPATLRSEPQIINTTTRLSSSLLHLQLNIFSEIIPLSFYPHK